jgi:heme/copper-type cytochrome/quinol oxidase subunit 2
MFYLFSFIYGLISIGMTSYMVLHKEDVFVNTTLDFYEDNKFISIILLLIFSPIILVLAFLSWVIYEFTNKEGEAK